MCLDSDVLCPACKERLHAGDIQPEDIPLDRALSKISKSEPELSEANIIETMHLPGMSVLVVDKGDGRKVVGREGKIVKTLTSELEKDVFVLEKSDNEDELIQNLAKPARVASINTVYTPEGERYNVALSEAEKRSPGLSSENFERLALKLTGKNYRLA